jgi:hypothetical protein
MQHLLLFESFTEQQAPVVYELIEIDHHHGGEEVLVTSNTFDSILDQFMIMFSEYIHEEWQGECSMYFSEMADPDVDLSQVKGLNGWSKFFNSAYSKYSQNLNTTFLVAVTQGGIRTRIIPEFDLLKEVYLKNRDVLEINLPWSKKMRLL